MVVALFGGCGGPKRHQMLIVIMLPLPGSAQSNGLNIVIISKE